MLDEDEEWQEKRKEQISDVNVESFGA
jgi:hypothetical protein